MNGEEQMQIAERQMTPDNQSFWGRPVLATVPVSREAALYAGLFVVAAILRLWDLGPRMLHHDESLHATYSYYLYSGRGYRHDPMMHGPWQFTVMAFTYFLLGASDATARMPHALFGSVLAVLPFLLRKYMGRTGAFVAAVFIAFSPAFLYFARFAREDAFVVTWTLVIVVAMVRYLDRRKPFDLYLMAAALSLGFSTKENTYITSAIILSFLLMLSIAERRGELLGLFRGRTDLSPQGDLVVAVSTLILPPLTGFLVLPLHLMGVYSPLDDRILTLGLAVLVALAAVVGMHWDRERWIRAAAVFWGIFVVLHTTFFTNPGGVYSGAVGALKYWIEQQGVARGEQPWYYYLLIVPLYEFVIVGFGLAGIVYWARKRNVFALFVIWWIVSSQIVYGYTSEKMPWLVLHLALPFALLAGMTVGQLFDRIRWREILGRGAVAYLVVLLLALAAFASLVGRELPLGRPLSTIAAQQALFQWLGMAAVLGLLVGLAVRYGRRLGRTASWQMAVVGLLVVLMAFSIRTAWQAVYYHGDIPVEMLVYTQTSPDVGKVMKQIETLAYRTGATKETFKVAYDSGVSWPFEWYLRDYRGRNFYGAGTPAPDAPIVLASFENNAESRVRAFLGNRYVGQRYRLRAWFDESAYRAIGADPLILWRAVANPEARERFWRFLLYREPLNPSGSTDFVVFVRRDLASGPWAAPIAAQQTPDDELYAARTRQIPSLLSWGSPGADPGQFNAPKGIAIGPDGSVYVADGGNHRIQRFDATGKLILAWGSRGQGDGQFNEPWGIAVDKRGVVYVADTWNHRVQVFDSLGRFLAKWGGPGQLFGPRSIAFTPDDQVLVADTGNHRVVVFDRDGNQVGHFGGRGGVEGFFAEPVGIAVDAFGHVYVADTWNRRIQKLDLAFRPLAQWPIAGWESESILNKPYLAVDAEGNVYASDPEGSRVLKFGGTGNLLTVWGRSGVDTSLALPIGLAVDEQSGSVFVVDGQSNRVVKFGPVR